MGSKSGFGRQFDLCRIPRQRARFEHNSHLGFLHDSIHLLGGYG